MAPVHYGQFLLTLFRKAPSWGQAEGTGRRHRVPMGPAPPHPAALEWEAPGEPGPFHSPRGPSTEVNDGHFKPKAEEAKFMSHHFCCLLESLIKSTDCYTRSWSTTTWRGTKCSEDELFQKEPVPPARLQRVLFAECSVSREKCNEGKWLSEFKWAHPGKFRRIISRSACCSLCSIKWGVSACLFEAWWPSINWPRLTTGAGSEAFSSGPWDL